MQFSFRKPHFWHPQNFAKTLFWHTVALFVFLKMPKKHYKTGEKQQKKIGPVFNTRLGPVLTLETPNLGPVFNSTAYIYIYVYADESDNGTLFAPKRVRQRDAHALNNGTRPVSHCKNSGFPFFGGGGQLAMLGRRCDWWTMPKPRKLVGLVFRIFGLLQNRISSFGGFVSFSLYFFELGHWKLYKNRGFREHASEDILLLEAVFWIALIRR